MNKKESEILVSNIQEKTGLSVKEINMKLDFRHVGKRYIKCASIETFLKLIDEAEYVISNSFHGIAFSIILKNNFMQWEWGIRLRECCHYCKLQG